MTGDVIERLAAVLLEYGVGRSTAPRLAAALLPVVEELRREAAAEALRPVLAVADRLDGLYGGPFGMTRDIRAAALRAES